MLMKSYKFTKSFVPFLAILLLIISCTGSDKDGIKTTISGSFPEFKGKKVTLSEIDVEKAIPIDTTEISESGKFKFRFRRAAAGFYLVKVDNKNYLTLVLDRESDVRISSTNVELRKGYQVEGSDDSEYYRQFEMFLETNRKKVDSLSAQYRDFQRSAGFEAMKLDLDENYKAIFEEQREYATNFIDHHCGSLASLLILNRRFGQRKIMDEEKDFRYFSMADSCLALKYPENKHFLAMQKRVDQMRQIRRLNQMTEEKLAIGNKAPDISLQDPNGKQVALYSLAGSPVIITFTSTLDQNSKKSVQALKGIIAGSSVRDLKVYAIGLESYKEMWINSIKNDQTENWIHVTDYLGFRSYSTSLYNVPDKLPYFLLLDKDLAIRYRGSDFNQFETALKELR
jgi:hypothetical protein